MTIEKLTLKIVKEGGASCPSGSCADSFQKTGLERALMALIGVSKVNYDVIGRKVKIEYNSEKIQPPKITRLLEKLGYRIENKR
ncbi:MAG: heavy-metal-associated domain-containing protein [Candidatus Freyarchaeota archaeon]|nr:heavy-metal-associated domain-containing protein [Candidatus Jordarchaeia archaeon]MBS7278202.1 heavy-metal-associated domain-containing protein [Candidatus Jordarchaeia archaeon]